MWITVLDLIFCDLQVSLFVFACSCRYATYVFRAYLGRFIPVYFCLQILRHVAAIFMVCNFNLNFVSIFECSTSFVPIYLILTLCFYQLEDVSMNLDLLKRIHVLDTDLPTPITCKSGGFEKKPRKTWRLGPQTWRLQKYA